MRKFLFLFIILFSCNINNEKEEKNKYQILSLLYDELAQSIEPLFPPPPPDSLNYVFSSKDSVRINTIIKKIKTERENKKFLVAVNPLLYPYKKGHQKYFMKDCSNYNGVMDKLISIKDSLKVDIDKIITKRNDSIIYFKEDLIIKGRRDYETFDVLISFSRIAFNKDYTKAVIVGSLSTSTLAGASILYFLEKTDDIWKVKCTKALSIS